MKAKISFQKSVLWTLAYALEENFKPATIPVCLSESCSSHDVILTLCHSCDLLVDFVLQFQKGDIIFWSFNVSSHLFKCLTRQMCFSHFQAVFLSRLVSHFTVSPPVMKSYCGQVVECRVQVMSHVFYKKWNLQNIEIQSTLVVADTLGTSFSVRNSESP